MHKDPIQHKCDEIVQITPETKIGALSDAHPQSEEVPYSSRFSKVKKSHLAQNGRSSS